MKNLFSIGLKLRTLRKIAGLKQSDLAQTLGISQQMYSKYENDSSTLNLSQASMLAKALGITLEQLISEDYVCGVQISQKWVSLTH